MFEQDVQIPLPIASVRRAWRRYVEHGVFDSEGENGDWRADDGSGLVAHFTSDGPTLTKLTVHASDDDAGHAPADQANLVTGFLSYVEEIDDELRAVPGSTAGSAPVGPDGTAHMPEIPKGLGSDESFAGDGTKPDTQ